VLSLFIGEGALYGHDAADFFCKGFAGPKAMVRAISFSRTGHPVAQPKPIQASLVMSGFRRLRIILAVLGVRGAARSSRVGQTNSRHQFRRTILAAGGFLRLAKVYWSGSRDVEHLPVSRETKSSTFAQGFWFGYISDITVKGGTTRGQRWSNESSIHAPVVFGASADPLRGEDGGRCRVCPLRMKLAVGQ